MHILPRQAFPRQTLRLLLVALLPLLSALSLPARAVTARFVPSQYATIQAAVNAAFSGDVVIVAPGTYSGTGNRDIELLGKNLVVEASGGAASTVIDCGGSASSDGSGSHRAFYIHQGETDAVILGFTIKNGYEAPISGMPDKGYGGGVYIVGSSVNIQGCILTNNNAQSSEYDTGEGGGIYSTANSVLSMTDCTFVGNIAFESGAGLFNGGTATLTGCIFTDNTQQESTDLGGGAGIFNKLDGALALIDCSFTGNRVQKGRGGGINNNGTATMTGCTFVDNSADGYEDGFGGGVYNNSTQLTLTGCAFIGNTGIYGGGMFDGGGQYSSTKVTKCIFGDNTALFYGGGIYNSANETLTDCTIYGNMSNGLVDARMMTVTNCTITGNSFGGISASTRTTVTNTILYGDSGGEIVLDPQEAPPTLSYCDVQGGYTGTGNINADPLFADPANGDTHLKAGSPCLAKGTHTGAPTTDLDGRTRPNPPSIGAYELAVTRSVPSQYSTIQAAVDASLSGDTILLANGTYTGTGNRDVDLDGKSVTLTSQNGAGSTILNCQATATANHRAFYIHRGETNVVLSGLTMENGYTLNNPSTPDSGDGGGVNVENSGVTLQNCVLTDNVAQGRLDDEGEDRSYLSGFGGGVYAQNATTGRVTLTNTSFTGNTAYSGGGGLYFSGKGVLTGCTFTGNNASSGADDRGGGGVDNAGAATLTGCTFTNNTGAQGGGLQNEGVDNAVLTGCSFQGNTALYGGGINSDIPYNASTVTLTACKFLQNTAQNSGGALFNETDGDGTAKTSGTISAVNCTLFDNTSSSGNGGGVDNDIIDGGGIVFTNCTLLQNTAPGGKGSDFYNTDTGGTLTFTNDIVYSDSGTPIVGTGTAATVTYCDVLGGFTGTHDINVDPQFVRTPNLAANPSDYGDLRLQPASPCLGKGNHAAAPATDKGGTTRPNPPSIGAFEALAVLQSLTFTPTTVGSNSSTTGTITLAGPVSVPTMVSLHSSSAALMLRLTTVTIAAGATSAQVNAYSQSVTSSTNVVVTATLGSVVKSVTVTILPLVTISSLTLSPTSVLGGSATSTGTITLSGPAPVGGLAITQTSSNTSAATLAPTLNIAAGATSAKFKITTYAVTSDKTVTITATAYGTSKTATLTVTAPVTLDSFSLSPTSVPAGQPSIAKCTLVDAAPAGGAVIACKSSDTSVATVQSATVTVDAGNKTKSFTVTTKPVTSTKTVTITVTVGSSTKTATLTVTPAVTIKSLSLSPTSVVGGSATSTGTITLSAAAPSGGVSITQKSSNTSAATLSGTLNIAAGATSAKFKITTLAVSSTKTVTITSTLNGASKTATLTVTH